MIKRILAVLMVIGVVVIATAAAPGFVDWIFGIKNKPELDPRSYVFQRTAGLGASGTLGSAGSGKSITLSPCPAGIVASSATHASVRISGGTGTGDESVLMSTVSISGANCTIGFTTTKTHNGSWIIGSASGGLQEALMDGAPSNTHVRLNGGQLPIYATVYVPGYMTIRGAGPWASILLAETTSGMIILNAEVGHNTFEDFGFLNVSSTLGGSGNIGISLGTSSNDAAFMYFTRLSFDYLYDDIVGINASQMHVTDCVFYDFGHTAITVTDTLNPDNVGIQMENSLMFNYLITGTPAVAAVLIHSTSSNQFSNNLMIGQDQMNWCIDVDATASGGWSNYTGNKCESPKVGGFRFVGQYTQMTFVGNSLGNTGTAQSGWNGMQFNGTTGGGMYEGTISGNIIQCGSTANNGVIFNGIYTGWTIIGNTFQGCSFAVNANSGTPDSVYIGPNVYRGILSTPVYASTSAIVIDGGTVTYFSMTDTSAGIGNAGNGSRVYCSNCISTCGNSGGTGRTCFRENNAWTH